MPRVKSNGLNEKEKKVLEAIQFFHRKNGIYPSIREIGQLVGIESTSHVKYIRESLEKKGYIEVTKGKARSIRAPHLDLPPSVRRVPLLGRIQAGLPIHIPDSDFALFDCESYIDLPLSLLGSDAPYFALQVQGDSMIDAHVTDGDEVILRATHDARNGEMVAAWIKSKNETTLKFWFAEKDRVRLQPANKAYEPIYVNAEDVTVQGVVVRISRVPHFA